MSLTDPSKKMSKSDETNKGCIYLLEDPKAARKKIMGAVTDSYAEITADKIKQPGLYNLMEIAASLTSSTPEAIALEYSSRGYGDLKNYVGDVVENFLIDLQSKYNTILKENVIEDILEDGKNKASIMAEKKLAKVMHKVGLEIR